MKLPTLIPRFPVAKPPLTLACGCFLQLPEREIPKGDLPNYEKYYRETNPAYHHREGYYFFFQFPTAHHRNQFIKALALSYKQMGMATKSKRQPAKAGCFEITLKRTKDYGETKR